MITMLIITNKKSVTNVLFSCYDTELLALQKPGNYYVVVTFRGTLPIQKGIFTYEPRDGISDWIVP